MFYWSVLKFINIGVNVLSTQQHDISHLFRISPAMSKTVTGLALTSMFVVCSLPRSYSVEAVFAFLKGGNQVHIYVCKNV